MTTTLVVADRAEPLLGLLQQLDIDPAALAARLSSGQAPAPTVAEAIRGYLDWLAVGKSPRTVISYRTALRRFCEFLESRGLPADCTSTRELPSDVAERFVVALTERQASKQTVFAYSAALRSFLKWLFRRRIGLRESSYELVALGLSETTGRLEYQTRKVDRRLGEVVDHVRALPLPRRPTVAGAVRRRGNRDRRLQLLRDRALLMTLWCTGARVSEVVSLDRGDLDDGRADQALILGKGNKQRVLFFDPPTLEAIRAYLHARNDQHAPLFIRHNRGPSGSLRLESQSAWLRVRAYAEELGIHARPHDFRHAFACRLLNNGASMGQVQALLGHSSAATTSKIYARYDVRSLRAAYDQYAS